MNLNDKTIDTRLSALRDVSVVLDTASPLRRVLVWVVTCVFRIMPAPMKKWLAGTVPGNSAAQLTAHLHLDLDQQLLLRYNRTKRLPSDFPAVRYLTHSRAAMSRDAGLVAGLSPRMAATLDLQMRDPDDAHAASVPGRLYIPSTEGEGEAAGAGLMVYFHGGGWVQGSIASHEGLCQMLAHGSGMRVLSVEYRLAPEHPFPAPLEDAWTAYRYAHSQRQHLSNGGPLVLAGDSAGGNLAAVVAMRAAQRRCPADAQLLLYPVTDLARAGEQTSRCTFGEGFFLTRDNMQFYEDCYVSDGECGILSFAMYGSVVLSLLPSSCPRVTANLPNPNSHAPAPAPAVSADRRDPEISPAYMDASQAARLPPALVITAGYDVLRDEGRDYAQMLQQAGVRAVWLNFEDCIHGFLNFGCTERARVGMLEVCAALRGLLLCAQPQTAPAE